MIEISKLTKTYEKSSRALKDVSLTIDDGEFVFITGRSGSGKSTLAKLINAILVPGEGCIEVDGIDTRKPEMVWEIRQRAGMVFQNPDNQIVTDTVWHELAFGLESIGMPQDMIRVRVARFPEKSRDV